MANKNVAVFGIYATPGTAEAAVDHLLANGFTNAGWMGGLSKCIGARTSRSRV